MAYLTARTGIAGRIKPTRVASTRGVPIHPGFAGDVAFSSDWSPERRFTEERSFVSWYHTVNVKIAIYCRDSDPQAFEVEFERSEQEKAGNGLLKECMPVINLP